MKMLCSHFFTELSKVRGVLMGKGTNVMVSLHLCCEFASLAYLWGKDADVMKKL